MKLLNLFHIALALVVCAMVIANIIAPMFVETNVITLGLLVLSMLMIVMSGTYRPHRPPS